MCYFCKAVGNSIHDSAKLLPWRVIGHLVTHKIRQHSEERIHRHNVNIEQQDAYIT